jgi:hypothetical protein
MQLNAMPVNDDPALEAEATEMGSQAARLHRSASSTTSQKSEPEGLGGGPRQPLSRSHVVQFTKATPGAASKAKGGGVAPAVKKKKKLASMKALKATVKKAQDDEEWGFATGHTSSGQWPEEVIVRTPHSFAKERVRQVLRHVATAAYFKVKESVKEEQEVQAMFVDERLLISSNLPESVKKLESLSAAEVFEMLLSGKGIPDADERAQRDMRKLQGLVSGARIDDLVKDPTDPLGPAEKADLESIAKTITLAIKDPKNYLVTCSISQAAGYIKDAKYKNKLIAVTGLSGGHAEQNLVVAYAKSKSSSQALIYGKKRPCTGCYMTFLYATQVLKLNIVHSEQPGGFWGPALVGLWALMCEEKPELADVEAFVEKHLPSAVHRTDNTGKTKDYKKKRQNISGELTNYDSGSDSDNEPKDDKRIKGLRKDLLS